MELSIPRDIDGPEFYQVKICLRDKGDILIVKSGYNLVLEICVYEVEYPDGNKASIDSNEIAENMFAQVDGEGNIHVLFEEIIDQIY